MTELERANLPKLPKNMFWEEDRYTGKPCLVVNKNWPDGTRFRRRFKDQKLAERTLKKIETSIWSGTWREVKKELTEGPQEAASDYTIASFVKEKYGPYAEKEFTTDFTGRMLVDIVRIVGDRRLTMFGVDDGQTFKEQRISEGVGKGTVNHGLNVLSGLFEYAILLKLVDENPMKAVSRFKFKRPLRDVLEPGEVRLITENTLFVDQVIGTYIAVLAATGLRRSEGLHLKRHFVNLKKRQLVIEPSKNFKPRPFPIPLTGYVCDLIEALPKIDDNPYLFIHASKGDRMKWPNDAYIAGKKLAGITWPTFHDLRRYRATQWLQDGCRIDHVRDWLGHHSIEVTEKYLIHVQGPGIEDFRRAEQKEQAHIDAFQRISSGQETGDVVSPVR